MSKHASPLLGYNNNVRHKNRVFHIQTEDSGIKHPHIITHLFMDGGRILKSVKRGYAEHVGADGMHEIVKQMMKEQHKAMFIALRDGQFDHMLDGQAANVANPPAPAPKDAAASKAPPRETAPRENARAPVPPAIPTLSHAPPSGAPLAMRTDPAPPPSSSSLDIEVTVDDADMVPMTTRNPELTLDIGALERASHADAQPLRPQNDLPPPPANLFREKTASGAYSSVPPPLPPQPGLRKSPSIAPPPPKRASAPPNKKPPSENRYAAARPAAIFGQARPQQGSSIFGEDLISDKSLDEVILSYLAEDLEPTADKKK